MGKEIKVQKVNSILEFKDKFWQTLNLIRGAVSESDYPFILFLLVLKREGILTNLQSIIDVDVKAEIEHRIIEANKGLLIDIFRCIENTSIHLDNALLRSLIRQLNSVDEDIFNENCAETFDDLLYKLSKSFGRSSGEYLLPVEISTLMCNLIQLPANATVYKRRSDPSRVIIKTFETHDNYSEGRNIR